MSNKKFCRLRKTFALLLMVLFVMSVTAASASASCNDGMPGNGYNDGYNKGYEDGKMQAKIDCEKYGSKDVLSKIPSPPEQSGCPEQYKGNYKNGYEKGYVFGYNQIRYDCLKQK